jgi:hypothetical protein
MARKTAKGNLSGIAGKYVFYEMYGEQYARLRPARNTK